MLFLFYSLSVLVSFVSGGHAHRDSAGLIWLVIVCLERVQPCPLLHLGSSRRRHECALQRRHIKRLADHSAKPEAPRFLRRDDPAPCRQQNFDVGLERLDALAKIDAAHHRHVEIRDDEMERVGRGCERAQRVDPGGKADHFNPRDGREQFGDVSPQPVIIIHQHPASGRCRVFNFHAATLREPTLSGREAGKVFRLNAAH